MLREEDDIEIKCLKELGEMKADTVKCNWDKEKRKRNNSDKGKKTILSELGEIEEGEEGVEGGETEERTEMRAREHEGSKH